MREGTELFTSPFNSRFLMPNSLVRTVFMLKRFWFHFVKSNTPNILNIGCGITACNLHDAQNLLAEFIYPVYGIRDISNIIENVDIGILEEDHVRNNMGSPVVRGIWFPLI